MQLVALAIAFAHFYSHTVIHRPPLTRRYDPDVMQLRCHFHSWLQFVSRKLSLFEKGAILRSRGITRSLVDRTTGALSEQQQKEGQ